MEISRNGYLWYVFVSSCGNISTHTIRESYSRAQCNIGFAELAVSLPNSHVNETVPVLVDILRDIPYIDFDRCLAWDGAYDDIDATVCLD